MRLRNRRLGDIPDRSITLPHVGGCPRRRIHVLYLHVGPPKAPPAKTLETPEGHIVEYDYHGAVIGLELMGSKRFSTNNRICSARLQGQRAKVGMIGGPKRH